MPPSPADRLPAPLARRRTGRGVLFGRPLRAAGALALAAAAALGAAAGGDAVAELRAWTDQVARAARPPAGEAEGRLSALLAEVRRIGTEHPERGPEIDLALLDLGTVEDETLRAIARAELVRRLEADAAGTEARFLAAEVLDAPGSHPAPRRALAAEVLAGLYRPATLEPLLRATRDPAPPVRQAARGALVGWPDPAVHLFFLERLDRDSTLLPAALAHLEAGRTTLEPHALDLLRGAVGRLYVSADWRDAARAKRLAAFLDPPRAVPILIESLAVWVRRGETGAGSRRIQHEILAELRRISGRSMGPEPELWHRWWQAVRAGRIALPAPGTDGGEEYSAATFFGLHPATDRVIFVVDRSGSMASPMGTGGRSRYAEAIVQLERFLEIAGEETRFGIVVFNDRAARWRSTLVPATAANRGQARRWLEGKGPQRGTELRAGIRRALDAGRDGELDPAAIEADTLVVLCDGATAEGPEWVGPWLARVNGGTELVFHCVQIGTSGDGTLEALAAGTGGNFVPVE
ncbi:MAG: VWA domain-containing protein [Planctomycetota bacterium]